MATGKTEASKQLDKRIKELADWRGATLSKLRGLIKDADPEVVEEWKWVKTTSPGTPVWSHNGGICTGEAYKSVVKLTFFKGCGLEGSVRSLQLQPRGERAAGHRHRRRRQDQRTG